MCFDCMYKRLVISPAFSQWKPCKDVNLSDSPPVDSGYFKLEAALGLEAFVLQS